MIYLVFLVLTIVVIFGISGCVGTQGSGKVIVSQSRGHGPPPHAPAHGYRHMHNHGVELEFDSGLGVYGVLKFPSTYFLDGMYFRWFKSHWEVATHFEGPWKGSVKKDVPPKLWSSKVSDHPGKGRGQGKWKY
ncbi:MAG: hypothetical protein V1800_05165 [Candidatus Latescibacterota bacterium]